MLKIKDLLVGYSLEPVLHSINLEIPEGKIVALLGANGAGKSTTLKTISGLVKAESGSIEFLGQDITNNSPTDIVKLGIALSPEGRLVFPGMTVTENLKIGSFTKKYCQNELNENIDRAFELFPRLEERKTQLAGTMSGGEQQMLAIARALMSNPRLLMLDEPSLGLAPVIIDTIMDKIIEINKQGTTILLVEQNAELALDISHNAYCLNVGNVVLEGECSVVKEDKALLDAYLGGED